MHIYLDIDGTLIRTDQGGRFDAPAEGLAEFVIALRKHEAYWLTSHCMDGDPTRARSILKHHLPPELAADIDRIKPLQWAGGKTDAIDWTKDFLWLDDNISFEDQARFQAARPGQSFIRVDLRSNPRQLIDITRNILSE